MNVFVIGADRLGNIPERLAARGYAIIGHVSGRAAAHQRVATALPRETHLMILFTDFLGHNVMKSFRALARERGVPVLACRRSASALEEQLTRLAPA
jgi:hypothetical protein